MTWKAVLREAGFWVSSYALVLSPVLAVMLVALIIYLVRTA